MMTSEHQNEPIFTATITEWNICMADKSFTDPTSYMCIFSPHFDSSLGSVWGSVSGVQSASTVNLLRQ